MTTQFCIRIMMLTCLALTACDKLTGTKTISGEYRRATEEYNSNVGGTVRNESTYDFRSDGSYTMRSQYVAPGAQNVFTAKGTYTINGRKVELEQTSFAINDRPMGDKVTHDTFLLEDNGDLITDGGNRLKKQ